MKGSYTDSLAQLPPGGKEQFDALYNIHYNGRILTFYLTDSNKEAFIRQPAHLFIAHIRDAHQNNFFQTLTQ